MPKYLRILTRVTELLSAKMDRLTWVGGQSANGGLIPPSTQDTHSEGTDTDSWPRHRQY